MSTQNPSVEILTSVMLLGGGALGRWVGHECEALIIRINALWSAPSSLPTFEITMRKAMKEEAGPLPNMAMNLESQSPELREVNRHQLYPGLFQLLE